MAFGVRYREMDFAVTVLALSRDHMKGYDESDGV